MDITCSAGKLTQVERAWLATASSFDRLQFQQQRHGAVVDVEAGTAVCAGVPQQGMFYTFSCGHAVFMKSA
ncbi:hypothetical protein SEA_NUCCI_51 [Microbacterium phage Nucci]|nr:hypothetical protein SEA_NUCCI_51 [Microbacterium phage Nucci]